MLKKVIKNIIVSILISKCYCDKVILLRCMSCPIITDKMIIEHKKTIKKHNYDNSNEEKNNKIEPLTLKYVKIRVI